MKTSKGLQIEDVVGVFHSTGKEVFVTVKVEDRFEHVLLNSVQTNDKDNFYKLCRFRCGREYWNYLKELQWVT